MTYTLAAPCESGTEPLPTDKRYHEGSIVSDDISFILGFYVCAAVRLNYLTSKI